MPSYLKQYYFFTEEDFVSLFLLKAEAAAGLFSATIRPIILQVQLYDGDAVKMLKFVQYEGEIN